MLAFHRASEQQPEAFWPHCRYGESLLQLQRPQEAESIFRQAIEWATSGEEACWARVGLGKALSQQARWEDAVKAFAQATELEPQQFWALFRLGEANVRLQRWEQAADSFQRACMVRGDHFWARYKVGEVQTKLEHWPEAIKAFAAAKKIQPDSFAANFSLAKAYFHAQRWSEAAASFAQANRFESDNFWSHFHLGESLSELQRWEEAVAAFERAGKLQIDLSPIQRRLTKEIIKRGCGAEQVAHYELALAALPEDFSSHFYLGLALVHSDELGRAAASFQKSIELNPAFCPAYEQLGETYVQLQQFPEAEESFRKAIEISPNAQGWTRLGEVLLMQNRIVDGIAAFIQAIARDRTCTLAYARLGSALERDGRPADAIAVYQQAVSRGVTDEEIERRLAVAEEQGSIARSGERVGTSVDIGSAEVIDRSERMLDSNRPLLFVVCKDYGELALAMYLLVGQPFASNVTLMLPPRLYANNPDILPGRTRPYDSAADIRQELRARPPGILGLFSGYLLPTHHLCASGELDSLLRWAHAEGWQSFTSDPFLGLVDGGEERRKLVSRRSGDRNSLEELFVRLLTETHTTLSKVPHVYPLGAPPPEVDRSLGARLCFHNSEFFSHFGGNQVGSSDVASAAVKSSRWLFVLGSEDYAAQTKHRSQEAFCGILIRMLAETLQAGRAPTLIAPAALIDSIRKQSAIQKQSPPSNSIELLPHCEYSQFMSLLRDAEYVFYWNAVSFSALLRTLGGKPWFTFDSGHLINTMNPEYVARITKWFYLDGELPRLAMSDTLTCESLQQAARHYEVRSRRIREALLASSDPQSLLATIADPRRWPAMNDGVSV